MQTDGYEPIPGIIADDPAGFTQPVTFSLLRKSRQTGDFVTICEPLASLPNTAAVIVGFRPFLPISPIGSRPAGVPSPFRPAGNVQPTVSAERTKALKL
jgi:hypothetical protein